MFEHMEAELLQSPCVQSIVDFFDSLRTLPSLELAKQITVLTSDEANKQKILTEEDIAECETCIICHEDLAAGEHVLNIPHACFKFNCKCPT